MSILQRHRPETLHEIIGQSGIVRQLKYFALDPHSIAMLYHGQTGCGKSATARCLAATVGVDVAHDEMGGLYSISSGHMGKPEVDEMMRLMRVRPMFGNGWKTLICNECDAQTDAAELAWLDHLDMIAEQHYPPKTLIIFTTNNIHALTDRFRDRCHAHTYAFESRASVLRPAIQAFAREIWDAECPGEEFPFGPNLGMRSLSGEASEHCSFRLALQQLDRAISERTGEPCPA